MKMSEGKIWWIGISTNSRAPAQKADIFSHVAASRGWGYPSAKEKE
jgi:hypothetical protein